MSHELEMNEDGSANMAYVGEVPWHGLGTRVDADISPRDMCEAAGLLWTVEKVQGYIDLVDPNGQPIKKPIPRHALIRSSDNRILDTVPPKWNPLQNEEAFEFFQDFVEKGEMSMHTAGSLKDGQLPWALAKVEDSFVIGKDDLVESFILFTNPHQFGKAIDIRFTPIRVVCWNTMCMAMGARGLTVDQQVVKESHRKPFNAERVKETLGIAAHMLQEYRDAANFISKKRAARSQLNEYFMSLFPKSGDMKHDPISRNHSLALQLLETQPGATSAEGSWWQAFNSVTYMVDHRLGRTVQSRLESAWFGANRKKKSEALNLAVEMAGRSPDLEVA